MLRLTPYYAYRIYYSIREHFLHKFNIVSNHWKFLDPKPKNFDQWPNSATFKILVERKITSENEWVSMLIVMFMSNPSIRFGDLLNQFEYWQDRARLWREHIDNMPYTFQQECQRMVVAMYEAGVVFDRSTPAWIFDQYNHHKICVETFIILKRILKISLDGIPDYEYLYRDQYGKYELLLNVNIERYRTILEKTVKDEKIRRITCKQLFKK